MLIINFCPKSANSLPKLIQSLNSKKIRYFADFSKNQMVCFDDNKTIVFFETVSEYCDITAIMNEKFAEYPFMDYDLNSLYTGIVQTLLKLESTDPIKTHDILKNFKQSLNDMSSTPAQITPELPQPPAAAQNETVSQPEMVEVQTNEPPAEIKSIQKRESLLYPYLSKGIDVVKKLENPDKYSQIHAFLTAIKYPKDAEVIKMFSVLGDIPTITYKNILASPILSENKIMPDNVLLAKMRTIFRNWAQSNCPRELESNPTLSFIDILKIYKEYIIVK